MKCLDQKPNLKISWNIDHQMTAISGYVKHILLDYLIKNNNDIMSIGHKKGSYFWYIPFCNINSLFQFLQFAFISYLHYAQLYYYYYYCCWQRWLEI